MTSLCCACALTGQTKQSELLQRFRQHHVRNKRLRRHSAGAGRGRLLPHAGIGECCCRPRCQHRLCAARGGCSTGAPSPAPAPRQQHSIHTQHNVRTRNTTLCGASQAGAETVLCSGLSVADQKWVDGDVFFELSCKHIPQGPWDTRCGSHRIYWHMVLAPSSFTARALSGHVCTRACVLVSLRARWCGAQS